MTPSTTLRRLMAPSISGADHRSYVLQVAARRLARLGDANLLAVGDIGLADGDHTAPGPRGPVTHTPCGVSSSTFTGAKATRPSAST